MSGRDLNLVVTQTAQADLRKIFFYTLDQWGAEQARGYEERIWATINHLTRNPQMGHISQRVTGGIRSFTVGHHTIYYQLDAQTISVLGVVHYRQEFKSSMIDDQDEWD
jgi:toxin ParE1/3/4